MRKLTLVLALAIAVAFAGAAYAEVQNVKVSGDITVYQTGAKYDGFYRDNVNEAGRTKTDYFWMETAGVNIDADLTENVGAHLRAVNMKPWGLEAHDNGQFDIGLAEASITLREMLYEPLTITIGRQPLYYGRGFIIGSNVVDPEGHVGLYDQYSLYDAFDSVKAELDLDPWKIDLVYALMSEDATGVFNADQDISMWLANIGYVFDEYNAEAEIYYAGLLDKHRTATEITTVIADPSGVPAPLPVTFNIAGGTMLQPALGMLLGAGVWQGPSPAFVRERLDAYRTHTFGIRGSMEPIENLSVFAEGAYQFGHIGDASTTTWVFNNITSIIGKLDRKISAAAGEVGAEYLFADVIGEPKIGAQYSFRQGERFNSNGYAQGEYNAFYTPFMRRSGTAIYGHNGRYGIRNVVAPSLANAQNPAGLYYKIGDFANSVDDSDTAWDTNMHQILGAASCKPLAYWDIEDINLAIKYARFYFHQAPLRERGLHAGDEVNTMLTYDYTEDVQFSLLFGYFWPSTYYKASEIPNKADASDAALLEGAVKLTF